MELSFHLEGEQRDADMKALKGFLQQEFPDWLTRRAAQTASSDRSAVRGDTLDLITLLVSIPSAVLAAWDLSVRLQLKTKIENLIAWAKARRARGQCNPFVVLPPDNKVVPLDQALPEQLLDAIAVQAKQSNQGKS